MNPTSNTLKQSGATRVPGLFARLALVVAVTVLFASCLLENDGRSSRNEGGSGYVTMDLSLERNERVLGKVASGGDTLFTLDSLIIVFTSGTDTLVERMAVSGRADTGAIALSPLNYSLPALRNWKAKFYTIDTTVSPAIRDTVHIDSVTFAVRPLQTTTVNKTISAAYAIVRARFVSQSRAQLGNGIRYLLLRVGGVTRDSVALTGGKFNAVWFANPDTGWAVMDDGVINRSVDSGKTWFPQTSGVTEDLLTVAFVNPTTGWVGGNNGTVLKTTNAGVNWTPLSIGVSDKVRRVYFTTVDSGYVVGDNGMVLKTVNGGANWFPAYGGWISLTAGGSATLNDIRASASGDTVFAVGSSGTIRWSVNAGLTWTAMNSSTTQTLNALAYGSSSAVFAVGASGAIVKYAGSGTTWTAAATGAPAQTLNDVHFVNATNGWAVGAAETAIRSTNGSSWSSGASGWSPRSSSTSNQLNAVRFFNATTGWAAGVSGTIVKSTDAGISWTTNTSGISKDLNGVHPVSATTAIAVADSELIVKTTDGGSSWSEVIPWLNQTTGTTDSLKSISTGAFRRVIAVGAGGRVVRSSNGSTWTSSTTGSNTLNGVFIRDSLNAIAVGFGTSANNVRLTTDGGATWSTVANSTTSNELRGVWANSAGSRFYAVGASGTIVASANGTTWGAQTSTTANRLNAVYSVPNVVWAVGDAGTIRRITTTTTSATTWGVVNAIVSGSTVTTQLNSIHLINSNVAYIAGNNGLFLKTTDAGANWSAPNTGTTANLLRINFKSGSSAGVNDTGYVSGENGAVLKTFDGGTTWTRLNTGTTSSMLGAWMHPTSQETVYVAGTGGVIRKTISGGRFARRSTRQHLRAVYFYNTTSGFAVGDSGTIIRTLTTGSNWVNLVSGTTENLNAVHSNGSRAWAVGNNGQIRRITSISTTTWTSVTNVTVGSTNLRGVHFTQSNTGYVVGDGGKIFKCTNTGNSNWTQQGTGLTTENLRNVWFGAGVDTTKGWVIGDNGTILRTTNSGTNWAIHESGTTQNLRAVNMRGGVSDSAVAVGSNGTVIRIYTRISGKSSAQTFRGVHFPNDRLGYLVGDSGVLARTLDSGKTWGSLNSGVTNTTLRSVYFTSASTGWVVGDGGLIRKTLDSGSTWSAQTSGTSENLVRVRFATSNVGWVSGANGTLLRTTNGGTNWVTQTHGLTGTVGVFPLDTIRAFATGTGANGQAARTMSGGVRQIPSNRNMHGFHARHDSLYLVGASGSAFRSRNGGATWDTLTGAVANLNAVFSTGNHSYMVGDGGSGFFISHTLPGKVLTTRTAPTSDNLYDIWGAPVTPTSQKIFAVGDSGSLHMLTGPFPFQWDSLGGDLPVTLRGVNCTGSDTACWAVGDDETVLRTTTGGTWFQMNRGAKLFDTVLTYKKYRPAVNDSIVLQAMDRDVLPKRGYQKIVRLNIPVGKDTLIDSTLSVCGGVNPACLP